MLNILKRYYDLILFPVALVLLAIILDAGRESTWEMVELGGVLITLFGILLAKRENSLGLVASMLGNGIFVFYFIHMHLSGQMLMSIVFVLINIDGLYRWLHPSKKTHKMLRPTFMTMWPRILVAAAIITITIGGAVQNGWLGLFDYLVMASGIFGYSLIMLKKVNAWSWYFIGDVASLPLFIMTGSWLLFARELLYVYNDVIAYRRWHADALAAK